MDLLKGKNGWIRLKQWFLPPITGVSSVNRKFSPPILSHFKIFEELLVVFRPNLRAAPSSHFPYHPASKVTQGPHEASCSTPAFSKWKMGVSSVGMWWSLMVNAVLILGEGAHSENLKVTVWNRKPTKGIDVPWEAILGCPWESPGEGKTRNGQSTGWRSELIHSHVFDVWYLGCVWNWMIWPQFVAILLETMF